MKWVTQKHQCFKRNYTEVREGKVMKMDRVKDILYFDSFFFFFCVKLESIEMRRRTKNH